jgi:hypothetical protein
MDIMAEQEKETFDLKTIREMSFEDIIKKQILDALRIANEKPENLMYAVAMLEKLLQDELTQEYWQRVEEISEKSKKIFPAYATNEQQALLRTNYIAYEKFGLLISYVKSKIPQELILRL